MEIKHVSFDAWGTLLKSNPEYKPKRNTLLRDIFGDFIQDDIIAFNKSQFDIMVESTGYQPDYAFTMACILGQYMHNVNRRNFNLKVKEFRYRNALLVARYPPEPIKGVYEILSTLKDSPLTIGIISNTSFIEGNSLREVIGAMFPQTFSIMLFSSELGIAKPNPSLFVDTARAMKIPENTILHIGDNLISDSGLGIVQSLNIEVHQIDNYKEQIYEICNLQHASI